MSVTSHSLRGALHTALDGHAVNRRQHRVLFNADPGVDSLAERIVALRDIGVDDKVIRELLADVRQVLELNDLEDGCHTSIAGSLDGFVTALRHAELNTHVGQALGVKAIARTLREPLRVIGNPNEHDAMVFVAAVRTVDRIVASVPASQLLSTSVHHELRDRSFRMLEQLVAERAGETS